MSGPLAPLCYETRSLSRSRVSNSSDTSSYVNAFTTLLWLFAQVLLILLLFGLLVLTGVVWLWLASFRSGSRFGAWIHSFWKAEPDKQDKLTLTLVSSSIVGLLTPFAVFNEWAKQLISEKVPNPFPPAKDLKQIIESNLGIKLPEDTPCFPKADTDAKQ